MAVVDLYVYKGGPVWPEGYDWWEEPPLVYNQLEAGVEKAKAQLDAEAKKRKLKHAHADEKNTYIAYGVRGHPKPGDKTEFYYMRTYR